MANPDGRRWMDLPEAAKKLHMNRASLWRMKEELGMVKVKGDRRIYVSRKAVNLKMREAKRIVLVEPKEKI